MNKQNDADLSGVVDFILAVFSALILLLGCRRPLEATHG
jgi:hypothetical protein